MLEIGLFAALFAAQTAWGLWLIARAKGALARGEPNARVAGYLGGTASDWIATFVVAALWLGQGRAWSELGLTLPEGAGGWATTGAIAVLTALYVMQNLRAAADPEQREKLAGMLADVEFLLPHDDREQRTWNLFSITAGITEEVVYRGFALAVLTPAIGTLGAVVLSSVFFGLMHSFQGRTGMIRAGVSGLILAGMYLLSGSLLGPILFHTAGDVASGVLGRAAFGDDAEDPG